MNRQEYEREWRRKNKEKIQKDQSERYRNEPELYMLRRARHRAQKEGLAFDLTLEDIYFPEFCPLLGVPLDVGGSRNTSPSLDRIEPGKGYVKGNVWVISYRANRIKQDASFQEFEMLYQRWKKMKEMGYPELGKGVSIDKELEKV